METGPRRACTFFSAETLQIPALWPTGMGELSSYYPRAGPFWPKPSSENSRVPFKNWLVIPGRLHKWKVTLKRCIIVAWVLLVQKNSNRKDKACTCFFTPKLSKIPVLRPDCRNEWLWSISKASLAETSSASQCRVQCFVTVTLLIDWFIRYFASRVEFT